MNEDFDVRPADSGGNDEGKDVGYCEREMFESQAC